jgi:hypothetical protein
VRIPLGYNEDTHVLQLQNLGWAFEGSFDDLPNRGVGQSEPEPASTSAFDAGLDYSNSYINHNNMNAVSLQRLVVNRLH